MSVELVVEVLSLYTDITMSYEQAYEFDYMADEGEVGNFLDEMEEENNDDRDVGIDEYEMVRRSFFVVTFVFVV